MQEDRRKNECVEFRTCTPCRRYFAQGNGTEGRLSSRLRERTNVYHCFLCYVAFEVRFSIRVKPPLVLLCAAVDLLYGNFSRRVLRKVNWSSTKLSRLELFCMEPTTSCDYLGSHAALQVFCLLKTSVIL